MPTISLWVMGRPSISAFRMASTTSSCGGSLRRRSTKSLIHRSIVPRASRPSGVVGRRGQAWRTG